MNSIERASDFPISELIAFENGELSEEQTIRLFQRLIDDGSAWKLQGFYGRIARDLIQSGRCLLGPTVHRDSFGNDVPSREEIPPGSPGTPQFVERMTSRSPTSDEA